MLIEVDEIIHQLDDLVDEAQLRAKVIGKIYSVINNSNIISDEKIKEIKEIIEDYLDY